MYKSREQSKMVVCWKEVLVWSRQLGRTAKVKVGIACSCIINKEEEKEECVRGEECKKRVWRASQLKAGGRTGLVGSTRR